MIVYVERDESGKIIGVYANFQEGFAEEALPEDDPEVVAFLNPPPPPYTLQMSDFFSRFTNDDEYDAFDAALSVALPAKDRRAFNVATSLRSDSTLFAWARVVLVGVVGETRADEIMAPSTVYSRPSDIDV